MNCIHNRIHSRQIIWLCIHVLVFDRNKLTGRQKKSGSIIRTLFNELGHILNDSNTGMTVNFIEGRGADVVVNLMRRNHTLDYKWCNDLLVDMDIPFID